MRTSNRLVITTLLALSASICQAREPKLYSLASGADASPLEARVKLQRSSTGGALLLLTFDGVDPRSFPSMARYAAQVRSAEAALKPGQKPGLINASPGRNEPQLVGVTPGVHKYGVLFMLIDVQKGGVLNSRIASTLADKHLPDSNEQFVTVKHYEELTLDSQPGKNYYIQHAWSQDNSKLNLYVTECSSKWKECKDVSFQSANAQTSVLPGVSDQEFRFESAIDAHGNLPEA